MSLLGHPALGLQAKAVRGAIPGWKGSLLNVAGRAALVSATLSAIPVHTSIALCLSPWAIERIDGLRRAFIWAGSDKVSGGKCRLAWPVVCRPKELGGLGIADLRRTGVTLRVRWVWRDRQRGLAPATYEKAALALFQAETVFELGNGESTFFWTDRWLAGSSIQQLAPSSLQQCARERGGLRSLRRFLRTSGFVTLPGRQP